MPTNFIIRTAESRDLDTLVEFEVVIAKNSFGQAAVLNKSIHRSRIEKALVRDPNSLFVATYGDDPPVGWLWLASNTNFLTHERYANLRSLAVSPGASREQIAEALLNRGLRYAREHGLVEVTGKVHVENLGMRMLYRRVGLEPVYLTMRGRFDGEDGCS